MGYKKGVYKSSKAGYCKYRSSWELAYMKHLDSNKRVTKYYYENLTIDYISNKRTGRIRKYIPDFYIEYIDGTKELVEIKPSKKLTQVKVVKKIKAAKKWCIEKDIDFVIITEVELKMLKLI